MTDNDMMQFWTLIQNRVIKLISQHTQNCVKRIPAVVVSADNDARTTIVRAPYSTDESQNMSLLNCSGVNLRTGDNVWIEYVYGLDNAYVAIKNDGNVWGW